MASSPSAQDGGKKKKGGLMARLFHKNLTEKQEGASRIFVNTAPDPMDSSGGAGTAVGSAALPGSNLSTSRVCSEGAGLQKSKTPGSQVSNSTLTQLQTGSRPGMRRQLASGLPLGQSSSGTCTPPKLAAASDAPWARPMASPVQPAAPTAAALGAEPDYTPTSPAVATPAVPGSQPDCSPSLLAEPAEAPPEASQAGSRPAVGRILHVRVIAARNVIPADTNGLSDPYCIVQVGGQKHMSHVEEKTLNPQWNEHFVFGPEDVAEAVQANAPCVRIDVYDWDLVSADDFLGQAEVEFSAAAKNLAHEPVWIPLHRISKHGNKKYNLGEISVVVWFQEGGQGGEAGPGGGELSSLCYPPGQQKRLPLVVHAKGNSLYEEPLIACLAVTLDRVRGAELGSSSHLSPDVVGGDELGPPKRSNSSPAATTKLTRFRLPFRKRSNTFDACSGTAYSSRSSETSEVATLEDNEENEMLDLVSEELPPLVEDPLPSQGTPMESSLGPVLEDEDDEPSPMPAAAGLQGTPSTADAAAAASHNDHFLYCKLLLGRQVRQSFVRRERGGSARFSQRFVFGLPVPVRTDRQLVVELYRTPSSTRKGKLMASTQIWLYDLLPQLAGVGPEGEPHLAIYRLQGVSKKAAGTEVVLQSVACDQDSRRALYGPQRLGELPPRAANLEGGQLLRHLQSATCLPSPRQQKLKAALTEESYQQWQERLGWAKQTKELAGEAKELALQQTATWGHILHSWGTRAAQYVGLARPLAPSTSPDADSSADGPTPQAADAPPLPQPPATMHLNIASLQLPPSLASSECCVIIKAGPQWGKSKALSLGPQGRFYCEWELSMPLHDPSTLLLLTVFSQPRRFKGPAPHQLQRPNSGIGGNLPQMVGKLRVRLSCLQPNQQMSATLPLLSERKKGAQQVGSVKLSLQVKYASGQTLLKSYLGPLLPAPAYAHGCDDAKLQGVMEMETRRIALRWLESVHPAITRPMALAVLDLEREEFQMSRLRANLRRFRLMAAGIGRFKRWFVGIQRWDNSLESSLVAAALVFLAFRPSTCLPLLLGWAAFAVACKKPEAADVLPMESDPPEIEPEDLELATSSTNPYTILMRKYESLVGMMLRVQNVAGDLASALEKMQALASWADPVASTIFVAVLAGLALLIYFLGLSFVVAFLLFWVVRPPRLRTPTPSPPANLFRRLPSRADRIM